MRTPTSARRPRTLIAVISIAGRSICAAAARVRRSHRGPRPACARPPFEQVLADRFPVAADGRALEALDDDGDLARGPGGGPGLIVAAQAAGPERREGHNACMEGSAQESVGTQSSWLRCYRCWSQNLEVQLHYEGILKVDADTGEAVEPVEEVQEAVVQCLDCLHDQPHLALTFYDEDGRRISRIEPVEDRWERMVTGTPWVASCTVSVDADQVESCSGPEAAESLAFAAFGDHGTREFFTHVRFHKHEEDRIVIHMLVELYARTADEATDVMEQAARGSLTITSLAEESRPPASSGDDTH